MVAGLPQGRKAQTLDRRYVIDESVGVLPVSFPPFGSLGGAAVSHEFRVENGRSCETCIDLRRSKRISVNRGMYYSLRGIGDGVRIRFRNVSGSKHIETLAFELAKYRWPTQ